MVKKIYYFLYKDKESLFLKLPVQYMLINICIGTILGAVQILSGLSPRSDCVGIQAKEPPRWRPFALAYADAPASGSSA